MNYEDVNKLFEIKCKKYNPEQLTEELRNILFQEAITELQFSCYTTELDIINRKKAEIDMLKKKNAAKCATCVFAVQTTEIGVPKCYVECTNQEHIKKYCHRQRTSRLRQRTTPACRHYKERPGEKMAEIKVDCFGYDKVGCQCKVMEELICRKRNCTFYKTREQFLADMEKYQGVTMPGTDTKKIE